jgi:hypothetical protein
MMRSRILDIYARYSEYITTNSRLAGITLPITRS